MERRSGRDRRIKPDPLESVPSNPLEAILRAEGMYNQELKVRHGDRRVQAKVDFMQKVFGDYVDRLQTEAERAIARAAFNEWAEQEQLKQQVKG